MIKKTSENTCPYTDGICGLTTSQRTDENAQTILAEKQELLEKTNENSDSAEVPHRMAQKYSNEISGLAVEALNERLTQIKTGVCEVCAPQTRAIEDRKGAIYLHLHEITGVLTHEPEKLPRTLNIEKELPKEETQERI